jgi:hypothetical protein
MVAEDDIEAIWEGITEDVAGENVPLTTLVTNKDPPPFSK